MHVAPLLRSALASTWEQNRRRHFLNKLAPNNIVIINSARKIKNKTLAIEAAPAAMPPNPNMAAIMAITKKIIDQRNIRCLFSVRRIQRLLHWPVRYTLVPLF